MPTLIVSADLRMRWKIYCAKKGISIQNATAHALELVMKDKKIERGR